jgi:MFS family permease
VATAPTSYQSNTGVVTRSRRPLFALFASDSISLTGNVVAQVAVPWFVLETTGSAALTGVTAFFTFLPTVIALFLGGTVVDRLGFARTSVFADLASAVAVALIPALHLTVGIELWQLIALVFLGALLDAPGTTAREALLPHVAELAGMGLERASGMNHAIHRGSCSWGRRWPASSSPRWGRRTFSGSTRRASSSLRS